MSGNSREVDSYQQGKWRISVRENLENDRLDEGDFPDGHLSAQKMPNTIGETCFNVFKDNVLIAEIRGMGENRTIIPMREMNEEEEKDFYRFVDSSIGKI